MKILNLFFNNINSLEGETRIDFTAAPFSDSGVFAITGPNGSGKSSVLDAITLALYGETFRFDKPAAHVMTKQTNDCFAVLEFALEGEQYQSGWRVDRAETGELHPALMQLSRLATGEVLANTPQQVCTKMTELTGMNFRNFTRSILLAQGDFAAFLNALEAERMDILEKIISADIYADYKQQVLDNAQKVQQAIGKTEQQLSTLSLLPAAQQQAYEHDLVDYKEQASELRTELAHYQSQQAAVKNISVIQAQINVQKTNLKRAKTDAQQLEQKLATINDHQDILQFQEQVDCIHAQKQTIKQSKNDLLVLQSELVQLKSKLGDVVIADTLGKTLATQQPIITGLKNQLAQLTANAHSEVTLRRSLESQIAEKQAASEVLKDWLDSHAADESLLAHFPELGKLNRLQADVLDLNTQHKKLSKQAKESLNALELNTSSLEKEQKKLTDSENALLTNEQILADLAAKYTLDEVDSLRDEQQQRVKDFQELFYLAEAHQRLANKDKARSGFFGLFVSKKDSGKLDITDLELAHENLKQEVLREENIKKVLEQAVFREGLIKKMADTRQYLVDGKPCCLCGATEHPYSHKPPVATHSQVALNDQNGKIKNLLARTYEAGRTLEAAKQEAEHKTSNWARRQRLSSNWLSLCNRLNASRPELDIRNLPLMESLLKDEREELKNLSELANHYRQTQQTIVKLKSVLEKTSENIERLQASIVTFTADSEQRSQQQRELESKLQQTQQEEQLTREQVLSQLATLGETLTHKKKKTDELFDRLTARKQEYHGYAFRYKNALEDIAVLTEKQTACDSELKYCKEQLDSIALRLKDEENLGLQLSVVEKQAAIGDAERLLVEQNNVLVALQNALSAKITTTAFPTLPALYDILALLQAQEKLAQQLQKLHSDISHKTATMEKTALELEENFKLAETAPPAEQLEQQLKRASEQFELASLDVQRLEKLLNEQANQQRQQQKLQALLQQQQSEAQPYLEELALLDAEQGRAFRRKVQQQLANKLLMQTNTVLEKISGRYYLRQLSSDNGLALTVEDTLQNNAHRPPKSLSGGESFVVSLALALGLSELANNGRSVDSLFIDEGFGNLDAETLYTIISTLENLHTQGKTVGVISHVEAIQKRFKAQLQVVKKPNGMGMLQQVI